MVDLQKNLIVTRTFSKAFATEGIRLGYIIANQALIGSLQNLTQEFNVNRAARSAGIEVFKSMQYYKREMLRMKSIKSDFERACSKAGLQPASHNLPFTLLVFDSEMDRDRCYDAFLKNGIITLKNTHEEFTGFDDPCIRVAIGSAAQMKRAALALKSLH